MKEKYVRPMLVNFKKVEHSIMPGPLPAGFLAGVALRAALGDNIITIKYEKLEKNFLKEGNL